ncbi:MAG: hypothetical protein WCK09_15935 [Bacteroidota bacterium]
MTNSPSQPWHNANLRQDNELENTNPIPVKAGEFTFGPTGLATGCSGFRAITRLPAVLFDWLCSKISLPANPMPPQISFFASM